MGRSRNTIITLPKSPPKQLAQVIGGLPVGYSAGSGIYSGYTLAGGDDFNGPLDVVTAHAPLAKYFTTHVYGAGSRTVAGLLARSYDSDPYHTGSQDANRGAAVGTNTLAQANSVVSLRSRAANSSETAFVNTRTVVGAMIHSGGYITVSPPCIIEARLAVSSGAPAGWHPTFWVMNAFPLNAQTTGSPGWLEFDFPECSSGQRLANTNVHGAVTGWASDSTAVTGGPDGTYHLYSLVITAAGVVFYLDGVAVKTESHDGTLPGKPYYVLLTAHTYDGTYGGDAGVNLAAWAAGGATGGVLSVDYYRVWTPSAQSPNVVTPAQQLPTLQVNYNATITYTFPALTALWPAGVTDYCQAIKKDDFEPGNSAEGTVTYDQFPAGLAFNSSTRVLSGITTDKNPGRLHLAATPYLAGGTLGISARGYIDVGPNITTGTLNLTVNAPYTHDLYPECNCGTLVPKAVTCTGLPAGLSFSPATGLITGTPTAVGTTAVTVGVTNAVGQTASASVSVVVAAAGALAIDGTPVSVSFTAPATPTVTYSTTLANDVVCLLVEAGGSGTVAVTSVTSTSGLTWTKRKAVAFNGTAWSFELWYAVSAAVRTNDVISVAASGTNPGYRLTVWAVNGANQTTPFDANASLPASATGTTAMALQAEGRVEVAFDVEPTIEVRVGQRDRATLAHEVAQHRRIAQHEREAGRDLADALAERVRDVVPEPQPERAVEAAQQPVDDARGGLGEARVDAGRGQRLGRGASHESSGRRA